MYGVQHDLDGGDALAVLAHHQALRKDGARVLREIQEDLPLVLGNMLMMRPASLRCCWRVRRQHEVARAGEIDGRFHGLLVADLTDENHVEPFA